MDDLVRVALAQNQMEAGIIVATLDAEGIRAMWRYTNFGAASGGLPLGGLATGPMEVLVLRLDADRARELLADAA